MWELATNMSEVLGGLLLLTWAITGHRAGRLVLRPSRAKLRRSALIPPGFCGGSTAWKAGWSHARYQESPLTPEAVPTRAA